MAPKTLSVTFAGDSSQLGKTFSAIGKDADGFGHKIGGIGKAAAIGLGGLVVGVAAAAGPLFNLGAELELMGKKAGTVFGDQLGSVQAWAKESAAAMGLTSQQAVGLAANFADLLIPMGFTRKQAADMATDVTGLSGALAEWSNGKRTAAEVSEILAKAMLGERDGLKELGISISEADVSARLAKNGTEGLTGAALEQAKALATQQLIMEKSTDAQKAYAEGAGSAARKAAEAKASFETMKGELATGLLPVFSALIPAIQPVIGILGGVLSSVVGALAPVIKTLAEALGPILTEVMKALSPVLGVLASALAQILVALLPLLPVLAQLISAIAPIIPKLAELISTLVSGLMPIITPIIGLITGLVSVLVGFLGPAITFIKGLLQSILAPFRSVGQTASELASKLSSVWNDIKAKVAEMVAAVKAKFEDVVAFIRGIPGKILAALGKLGSLLWDAGKSLMDGLLAGIKRAWENIKTFLSGLANTIRSLKGPLDKDRVLLTPQGEAIMEGFLEGLRNKFPQLEAMLTGIAGTISRAMSPILSNQGIPWADDWETRNKLRAQYGLPEDYWSLGPMGAGHFDHITPEQFAAARAPQVIINNNIQGSVTTENDLTDSMLQRMHEKWRANGSILAGV